MENKYTYYESTTSICNTCLKQITGKIIFEDNKVYLLKRCSEHGVMKELLDHDIDYYKNKRKYDKPGTLSKTQTIYKNGCPYDCGLCTEHDQHSCITLIEVTNRCNLNCSMCYANAGDSKDLSLDKISEMLDFVMEVEDNKAEILQISGGEPTLHKDIIRIIDLARNKDFKYVMLNTNGIRIAEDEEFVKELSKFVGKFEVYLQFDGFNDEYYDLARGQKLLDIKLKAIDNLNKYNIPTTLVATIENGVNDSEIGLLVSFGLENNSVRGINFQPVAYFGRKEVPSNRLDRSTVTDIINKIEKQTSKVLVKKDFIPLPCNVERVAISYLYKNKNSFVPLTRSDAVKEYLPYINNTFAYTVEDALALGNEIKFGCCNTLDFLRDFKDFVPKGFMKWDKERRSKYVSDNTFRISITSFVDRYNFDLKSMQKECVHVVTKDLKRIPFSAYNMIYRDNDE
ncbi:radical SAM protein [Mycoplasmatota bacterium WC44]